MPLVMTVVGARPQFIKAAPVSSSLRSVGLEELLVHTGQHYDGGMSTVFFETLDLPEPGVNLGIGSASHGAQTGRMLEALEGLLLRKKPDLVLVYGDTNSTLAGALAAAKQNVPVAHVEAGLRSFNRRMPEEVNRVLTDHVASLLFAPTAKAVENLAMEGITSGVCRTGDVMYDAFVKFRPRFRDLLPAVLEDLGIRGRRYVVLTIHRAENTAEPLRVAEMIRLIARLVGPDMVILWPVHPRLREVRTLVEGTPRLTAVDPIPYLEMQALVSGSSIVLTDSGGLQKEAAFHGVPCITLREETEWTELVELGVNRVVGLDAGRIEEAIRDAFSLKVELPPELYGDGHTSARIAEILLKVLR